MKFIRLPALLLLASISQTGWAVLTPPPGFSGDIGGNGYFSHGTGVTSIEIFDLVEALSGGVAGSTFGFFFQGTDVTDPGNLIPIFTQDDTAPPQQVALIDFGVGLVFDDDGSVPESAFSPSLGDIGFFLAPFAGLGLPTLFTDPALNPFGLDLSATFTSLADPTISLLGFEDPSGQLPNNLLALEATIGLTPRGVPEPRSLALMALGTCLLIVASRVRRSRRLCRPARKPRA